MSYRTRFPISCPSAQSHPRSGNSPCSRRRTVGSAYSDPRSCPWSLSVRSSIGRWLPADLHRKASVSTGSPWMPGYRRVKFPSMSGRARSKGGGIPWSRSNHSNSALCFAKWAASLRRKRARHGWTVYNHGQMRSKSICSWGCAGLSFRRWFAGPCWVWSLGRRSFFDPCTRPSTCEREPSCLNSSSKWHRDAQTTPRSATWRSLCRQDNPWFKPRTNCWQNPSHRRNSAMRAALELKGASSCAPVRVFSRSMVQSNFRYPLLPKRISWCLCCFVDLQSRGY